MDILIADDEKDILTAFSLALKGRGHRVVIARDGQECINIYQKYLKNARSITEGKIRLDSKESGLQISHLYDDRKKNNSKEFRDGNNRSKSFASSIPPFDVLLLDYRMPNKDGLETAKEILDLNPNQRIIFVSAYVKETLEESVKYLKRLVEMVQKPIDLDALVELIEDEEPYQELKKLMINIKDIDIEGKEGVEPSTYQIENLFYSLKRIQKGKAF